MQAVADLQERRAARSRITMMASPQREHGHLDVANELADWLARAPLNGSQFRLLWVVLRKTYGWQKKNDHISVSQFQKATGLHKQVIARELRELTKRGYITGEGDKFHAKLYAIQKDYTRWDGGKVYTDPLTDEVYTDPLTEEPNCKPISSHLYTDPLTDLYTDPLTTITNKTTKQKPMADSHESGASAAPIFGGTIRERYEVRYQAASNKTAVIGELFSECLGAAPNHGRLGRLSKELSSGGKLMDLIVEAGRQRITDDPHDYLAAMVKREKSGGTRYGKAGQADQNSGKRGRLVL